jgi:hypothetical protein
LIVAHREPDRSARNAAWWICFALGPRASAGAVAVTQRVAIVAAVAVNAARTCPTIPAPRERIMR